MARCVSLLLGLLLALGLQGCGGGRIVHDTPPDERERAGAGEAGSSEAAPTEDVPGRAPTFEERRAMGRLARLAEQIRGLRFERAVPFRVQDREVITQFVRDQVDAEELERARVFYVALGLLAPELDVEDLIIRVLGEQIVGYYDPERGLLVVREDVTEQLAGTSRRDLGEAEMVIVHELVHALQDQRLDLGAHYEEERTIDGDNAFAALVEGDATLAMIGHLVESQGQTLNRLTQNPSFLRMLVSQNPSSIQGQEIESAPPIIRLPLVSRYIDGMLFCAELHGGAGWPGVDSAHRVAPVSTEQVLHPDRYAAGERPDPIALPALPALEEAGFAPFEEESLGELETGIYFGLGRSDAERDESAAAGWGGDRLRVYRSEDGRTAVVWFTTWDDRGEATEAKLAAQAVAAADPEVDHVVEQRGRAVLVLRGVPRAQRPSVLAAFETFAGALPPAPPRDANAQ